MCVCVCLYGILFYVSAQKTATVVLGSRRPTTPDATHRVAFVIKIHVCTLQAVRQKCLITNRT